MTNGRGIISIVLGLILSIGMLLAYVLKIIADKRMLNRVKEILMDKNRALDELETME